MSWVHLVDSRSHGIWTTASEDAADPRMCFFGMNRVSPLDLGMTQGGRWTLLEVEIADIARDCKVDRRNRKGDSPGMARGKTKSIGMNRVSLLDLGMKWEGGYLGSVVRAV
jgi:hypothetical protein